jgi:uncharacterized membrane protein (UPF0127 family)
VRGSQAPCRRGFRGALVSMPSFLSPLLRDPSGSFRLVNARTNGIIADHLLAAFDSKSRKTGLLAHPSLAAGTAMIIAPTNAIHTFFMKFAIDVLFVAKDGLIVKTRESMAPWRVSAAWRAFGVVEVAAGTLARLDVKCGDRLTCVQDKQSVV